MVPPGVVLDTNVIVAALRSRLGASAYLLSLLGTGVYTAYISVALVLEYEDALLRQHTPLGFSLEEITDYLDAICALAVPQELHYVWRPQLHDPNDEFVLELAVAASSRYIVTFNLKHFHAAKQFGISAITPREFLSHIGVIP